MGKNIPYLSLLFYMLSKKYFSQWNSHQIAVNSAYCTAPTVLEYMDKEGNLHSRMHAAHWSVSFV